MPEYLHQEPGTEVRFIAGHYRIVEEERIACRGRELLCIVGIASVASSCCGTQGCRFVNVPGYIVTWKYRWSEGSVPVSTVEPVESPEEQAEIRGILGRLFPFSQIIFPA